MGLIMSHGCYSGPYCGFHQWRLRLAKQIGLEIVVDRGFTTWIVPWDDMPDGASLGDWPVPPAEPLMILLAHEDDAGLIRPADAALLADRLVELGSLWHNMVKGLRRAVAAREPVFFR